MRLAILGGGGFRTPLVYEAVAQEVTGMHVDEVVLFDVDQHRLQVMERITAEMAAHVGEGATSVRVTNDLADAVRGADVVMLLTPWKEFLSLDPAELLQKVGSPNIVDGRNVLNPKQWSDAGWNYYGMGRGVSVW